MVSVPVAAPSDVGANAMRMVQEPPAAIEGGDSEQVPPICKKSPVTAMLLIVSGTVWRFVRVSVWVELVVPWATLPNASGDGARVTGLTPVPVSATD